MYLAYTSIANATATELLKDMADVLTGNVSSVSSFGAACDKVNTSITTTIPAGWSYTGVRGVGDTVSWQQGTAANNFFASIYAFGMYIFCGASGAITTSPDSVNWTSRTSGFGTATIREIAFGNNTLVIVGDAGKIATSPDGINWTLQTGPFGTSVINSVTWAPWLNKFVAVDATGRISTSSNGATWSTAVAVDSGITQGYYLATNGTDKIMLGGYPYAYISTSTDATTWTTPIALVPSGATTAAQSVSHGAGVWVVGTNTGIIFTSADGITWVTSVAAGTTFGGNGIVDIEYFNGMFLAVASTNNSSYSVASSSDGYFWDQRLYSGVGTVTTYYYQTICCNPAPGGYWIIGPNNNGAYMAKSPSSVDGYSSAIIKAPCYDDASRFKYVRFWITYQGNISATLGEFYTNGTFTNTVVISTIISAANIASSNIYVYSTVRGFLINTGTVPCGVAEITRKCAQDNIANGYPQWGALYLNQGSSASTLYRLRHPTATTLYGYSLGITNYNGLPTGKVKGATLQLGLPFIPIYFIDGINQTGGDLSSLLDIWFGPYSYASAFDQATNNNQLYSNWNPAGGTTAGVRYWVPIK